VTSLEPPAGPLGGITVVALEQAVAAPLATRHLADIGARVIKVERPGTGDFARDYDHSVLGQSSYFVWLNRGKESITLDLKDADDRVVLDELVGRADVFVQNLAPGAADRLGLGPTALRRRHPRLITCSISGYGPDGPYRQKKAYDLLVQCEAGLVSITGAADQPAKVGISIADIATGMYAYAGILTALYERERTGEGSSMEVAMLDALGEWMSQPAYLYGADPDRPTRTGARHASIAPYGPFATADGTLFIAVQNDREWAILCREVLGRPELVDDPRFRTNPGRVAAEVALTAVIQGALSGWSRQALISLLDRVGIANAVMRTPADFVDHPQLAARHRWAEVTTPNGPVPALLPPVDVPGRRPRLGSVPGLGQQSAAIRAELGLGSGTNRPVDR
jgi:crotonobetainyl-CoA:carnitine CoA-transferase CaiB-like acyl-CoA transferase